MTTPFKIVDDCLVSSSWDGGTCSSATTEQATTLTYEDILKVKQLIAELPPEPFKTWMLENGSDPDRGWVLVLPIGEFEAVHPLPPYVRLSRVVTKPVMFNSNFMKDLW